MDDRTLDAQLRQLWQYNVDSGREPVGRRRFLPLVAAAAAIVVVVAVVTIVVGSNNTEESRVATEGEPSVIEGDGEPLPEHGDGNAATEERGSAVDLDGFPPVVQSHASEGTITVDGVARTYGRTPLDGETREAWLRGTDEPGDVPDLIAVQTPRGRGYTAPEALLGERGAWKGNAHEPLAPFETREWPVYDVAGNVVATWQLLASSDGSRRTARVLPPPNR